jgi:2'-5' RNA ligase
VFPCFKLPLHVTLYYFSTPTNEDNKEVIRWLQIYDRKHDWPIIADIEDVASFKKDEQDFVYYLPLKSKKIFDFNSELRQIFGHIYVDPFRFVPHLSLFYPQRNLNEKERGRIQELFQGINSISFDKFAFASESRSGIHYISVHDFGLQFE